MDGSLPRLTLFGVRGAPEAVAANPVAYPKSWLLRAKSAVCCP
jgi:hypothetical protein